MVGDLRERAGGGEADAAGDADPAQDAGADPGPELRPVGRGRRGEVQERLVDGVLFDVGREGAERGDDAGGEVAVELVVRGAEDDAGAGGRFAEAEVGLAHRDAEGLAFGRAGDDAAVVVAEDGDGAPLERKVEDALAGDVEVVGVDERDHGVSATRRRTTAVTTPKTRSSISPEKRIGG